MQDRVQELGGEFQIFMHPPGPDHEARLIEEFRPTADLVADLREKLETTLSDRAELENDIEKSKKGIAVLQSQLRERKAQQAPTESSPAIVDVKKESPSKSEAFADQDETLSPIDVMDWLFKRVASGSSESIKRLILFGLVGSIQEA